MKIVDPVMHSQTFRTEKYVAQVRMAWIIVKYFLFRVTPWWTLSPSGCVLSMVCNPRETILCMKAGMWSSQSS